MADQARPRLHGGEREKDGARAAGSPVGGGEKREEGNKRSRRRDTRSRTRAASREYNNK